MFNFILIFSRISAKQPTQSDATPTCGLLFLIKSIYFQHFNRRHVRARYSSSRYSSYPYPHQPTKKKTTKNTSGRAGSTGEKGARHIRIELQLVFMQMVCVVIFRCSRSSGLLDEIWQPT